MHLLVHGAEFDHDVVDAVRCCVLVPKNEIAETCRFTAFVAPPGYGIATMIKTDRSSSTPKNNLICTSIANEADF